MRGCFSFQGEKWHHAGTKYVPQPHLGQAPGRQEGERCSLSFRTVAGGVPCPGEPGAAALSPCQEAKALPTLVCPVTTLTRVTRRFRGLEHRVPLRMGKNSPGRDAVAHGTGRPGDVPGWAISADHGLGSKSSFPGQASCQGLANLARQGQPSTVLLPGWRRRKKQVSAPRPGGLCGGVWAPAVPQLQVGVTPAARGPWSIHPRFLEVTQVRTIQASWEIQPHRLQVQGRSFPWWLVGLELSPAHRTTPAQLGVLLCLVLGHPHDATIRPTAPRSSLHLVWGAG